MAFLHRKMRIFTHKKNVLTYLMNCIQNRWKNLPRTYSVNWVVKFHTIHTPFCLLLATGQSTDKVKIVFKMFHDGAKKSNGLIQHLLAFLLNFNFCLDKHIQH